METKPEAQESDLKKKLIILFSIVLALLVVLVCIVDIILYRRWRAARRAQPQIVLEVTAEPKSIPTMAPPTQVIMVVENTPIPTPEPVIVTAPPPSPLWRFLSMDGNDIGTFENVADTAQRLKARCIDTSRPPPKKGEIYFMDEGGVLKLEDGTKRYQRFKVTAGQ